jgi:erythromycin esterase-like protein
MFVGWAVVRRREFAEIAKRIAETLKWLIDAAYAGRKIMLWVHNAHVMKPGMGRAPAVSALSL